MATVFNDDGKRLSSLIVKTDSDYMPFYVEEITVNEATAKTYKVGQVIGTVTATGKGKIAVETAVDGSKVGTGIFIGTFATEGFKQEIPAATDTKVVVLVRGKVSVRSEALVWDATYDTDAKKNTAFATLYAAGVLRV